MASSSSRRSFLQARMLARLQQERVRTVAELAEAVGAQRPSVSRSLKMLRKDGLVERKRGGWGLTASGKEEATRCAQRLSENVASLQRVYGLAARGLQEHQRISDMLVKDQGIVAAMESARRIEEMLGPVLSRANALGALPKWADTVAAMNRTLNVNISIVELTKTARAVSQSLGPLVEAQRTLGQAVALASGIPDIGAVIARNNSLIAKALENIQVVHAASQLQAKGITSLLYPGVVRHVLEVNKTYSVVLSEAAGFATRVQSLKEMQQKWQGMVTPSAAVANFAQSLRSEIAPQPETEDVALAPLSSDPEPQKVLDELLARLKPDFVAIRQGGWEALRSNNPDRLRHAAASQRELIRMVLDLLVPDEGLDALVPGSKRKRQIQRVLEGSEGDFAAAMAQAVSALYNFLSKPAHTTYRNEITVEAALMAGDGLLLFLLSHRHKSA